MIVIISTVAMVIINVLVLVLLVLVVVVPQSSCFSSIGTKLDGCRHAHGIILLRVKNMILFTTRVEGAARIGFARLVLIVMGDFVFVFAFAILSFHAR